MAFETTGRRGQALEEFLREMEAASMTSEGPSRIELLDQLSVTLQKCNVAMVHEAAKKAFDVRIAKRRFAHDWL